MIFTSLHHHTTYSYMDGYGLPDDHFSRAADLGMSALAVTEHGNTSSHVKAEQAGLKYGVKPIFGQEVYTAPSDMREKANQRKWHMTVLAMDQGGYVNLNKMTTRAWSEGFYRWPTVTGNILQDHHEGLIVTSGCADSLLACTLLGGKGRETGDRREAERVIQQFKRLLGDRYYLEVQQFPELARTRNLNPWYEEMSRKYDVPLLATADCHYPVFEDNEMQKILHAAGRNIGTVSAAEAGWEYGIPLTLPASDAVIYKRLRATGLSRSGAEQAIRNTQVVAERCNVTLPKMERFVYPIEDEPDYVVGMTALDLIKKWLNKGWYYRGFDRLPAREQALAKKTAAYELDLFVQKGFIDYFLQNSEAVSYAKDNGCAVGPARGSAAASLNCFLLRITEINPMLHPQMMFERFIDPNRDDLPDIDLDFDDEKRYILRDHLVDKYGEKRVGNIGSFTRYRGKNSMDDVARVYEIPDYEVAGAKEFLVERSGGDSRFDASIEDTIQQFEPVRAVFDKHPDLYKAVALEGNLKGMGVHAAGLVISSEPMNDYVAMYSREVKGRIISVLSVDKYDGEYLGLMKIDALSLTTMGMIRIALEYTGLSLADLYAIPLDDPKTLAAFKIADVVGIFQFEGRTTRMVCQEVSPDNFGELTAINALSRPGPLHSGSTGDYIAVKHGRQAVEHIHPLVDELTSETQYQIIYQEQILALCRNMGKFPWVHASEIRKVISQKKGEAAFNKLSAMFIEGAESQGIDRRTADKTWKKLVTAGTYAFNVAHCVSYSTLAFWAMWLKVHHPIAFYAASLRKIDPNEKQRITKLMRDARSEQYGRDIRMRPPTLVAAMNWQPHPDGRSLEAGFVSIKGIGEKMGPAIIEARTAAEERGEPWSRWEDMIQVPGIGRVKVASIVDFATKEDPFDLDKMTNSRKGVVAYIKELQKGGMKIPLPDTDADDVPYENLRSDHVVLAVVRNRNLQDLYENHRSRTGEELNPATVKDAHLKDAMTLYMEDETGLLTVKVDRWRYPSLKKRLWEIKVDHDLVLMRVSKRAYYGKTVHCDEMWVIDPD